MPTIDSIVPDFVHNCVNLAHPRIGATVVEVSDDFFAAVERMLQANDPVFKPDVYDDNGKWMDGWESRRKRVEGYDHAIVKLGQPGIIKGIEIDTRHFTGNYAPAASVEGCCSQAAIPGADAEWQSIVMTTPLTGDCQQFFEAQPSDQLFTHIRLNIFPDGGVARFRVYGIPDASHLVAGEMIDLVAMENGGRAVLCNDEHFGHMSNLLMPGRGVNMGDGWETRRRREPGHDWVILALGKTGIPEKLLIDTAHFKGNYPNQVSVQAASVAAIDKISIAQQSLFWETILPPTAVSADAEHEFPVVCSKPYNVIRLNIHPDGGVSRIRVFGKIQ